MDRESLDIYNRDAPVIAARHRELAPQHLRDLVRCFFHSGGETADIGCGCGRDVAWLAEQGFSVIGYDASEGMLAEAAGAHPELCFAAASLPDLEGVPDEHYRNVLCSAVLMHLRPEDLITAILALARILEPGGRLLLTYRAGRGGAEREADGRLFTVIPPGRLMLLLEAAGLQVIYRGQSHDAARADVTWQTLVVEKNALDAARGLDRIQSILAQDRKTATYKLALIRALCAISRTEAHRVRWGLGCVYVPIRAIAVRWLAYYWPLIANPEFVAQIRGEHPNASKPIAFRQPLQELIRERGAGGLQTVLSEIEEQPQRHDTLIRRIAHTIRVGPVRYSGTQADPIFQFVPRPEEAAAGSDGAGSLGWVKIPERIWLDISRFEHWIEDSIVMRWAVLSSEMNPARTPAYFLPLLLSSLDQERSTAEVAALLRETQSPVHCVWSGAPLRGELQIDHVIPFSVWGNNDLWNLLPCQPRLNLQKSDQLPSPGLIGRQADLIVAYWRLYREYRRQRFDFQLGRALGGAPGERDWERTALAGLQETVQKLSVTRGLRQWRPR